MSVWHYIIAFGWSSLTSLMSTSPSITRPTHVLQAKQSFNNRQHSSREQVNEGHAAYPQMPDLQVKGSSKPASTPASNMYVSCTLNPSSMYG